MIPLITGAAVGAVSMFVYKDDNAKKQIMAVSKKLKDGATSLIASFKKKPVEETVVKATAEATTTEAENAQKKSAEETVVKTTVEATTAAA
jgi:alkyl hydroperoxide reductase subunit AhpF